MRWVVVASVLLGCHAPEAVVVTEAPVVCPRSTAWDGEACVWRYVVTDVRCPPSTVWDGSRCVGTQVACPAGSAWDSRRCVPVGQPPGPNDATRGELLLVTPTDNMYDERTPVGVKRTDPFAYR